MIYDSAVVRELFVKYAIIFILRKQILNDIFKIICEYNNENFKYDFVGRENSKYLKYIFRNYIN